METETKEKEILEQKLHSKLENRKQKVDGTLTSIESEGSKLTDFLVPSNALGFASNGHLYVTGIDGGSFKFHDHALSQFSEKMDVPPKYTRFLTSQGDWGNELVSDIFKRHQQNLAPKRLLFRNVDDLVKGVLSDRYKRMNTLLLMEAFIKAVKAAGGEVIDAAHGDTKNYMEAVLPYVVPIPTENNGIQYVVPGVQLRNSDYGNGAMELRGFMLDVRCLNGMVGKRYLREIHLGKQLPDYLSYQTLQMETQTKASAITDLTQMALSKDQMMEHFNKIKELSLQEVDMAAEIKRLPQLGLTKQEASVTEGKLFLNDPNDSVGGKNTKLKLVNALTATANEVEETRKREIQEIASAL